MQFLHLIHIYIEYIGTYCGFIFDLAAIVCLDYIFKYVRPFQWQSLRHILHKCTNDVDVLTIVEQVFPNIEKDVIKIFFIYIFSSSESLRVSDIIRKMLYKKCKFFHHRVGLDFSIQKKLEQKLVFTYRFTNVIMGDLTHSIGKYEK